MFACCTVRCRRTGGVVRDAAEGRRAAREALALAPHRHDQLLQRDAVQARGQVCVPARIQAAGASQQENSCIASMASAARLLTLIQPDAAEGAEAGLSFCASRSGTRCTLSEHQWEATRRYGLDHCHIVSILVRIAAPHIRGCSTGHVWHGHMASHGIALSHMCIDIVGAQSRSFTGGSRWTRACQRVCCVQENETCTLHVACRCPGCAAAEPGCLSCCSE